MEELLTTLGSFEEYVTLFSPRLLGAAAFLVIGAVSVWVLDRTLLMLCNRFNLDGTRGGQRLTQLAGLLGLETTPGAALRRLVRWTVMLVAVVQAALILELEAVAAVVNRAVWIIPIFVTVLIVLYVGASLGERLARAARNAAEREGTMSPGLAAGVARGAVLVTALLLVLEAVGITADLPVVILAICLTGALGLVVAGLIIGSRGLLENLLAARYVEENFIEGQMVTFRSEQAQIRAIRLMATVVRTGDGVDHTTPNAVFLKESV